MICAPPGHHHEKRDSFLVMQTFNHMLDWFGSGLTNIQLKPYTNFYYWNFSYEKFNYYEPETHQAQKPFLFESVTL